MRSKRTSSVNVDLETEIIDCPYCGRSDGVPWAEENGFTAEKCGECGLVYVNPRPNQSLIQQAVKTGVHSDVDHGRTAVTRRVVSKVAYYKKIFSSMFDDVWRDTTTITWLDVGAGYGEIVEAVASLAPTGSEIEGIEPMHPKAEHARARGLNISEKYLHEVREKFDFVSLINVYSHIPDFRPFLKDVQAVLVDGGEFFLESGNIGDLIDSREVPTELDLPDHLVFAGEKHLTGCLTDAGFTIVSVKKLRKDGLVNFAKNIIKKLMGRYVMLAIPYTSNYRSILIRAKLDVVP